MNRYETCCSDGNFQRKLAAVNVSRMHQAFSGRLQ